MKVVTKLTSLSILTTCLVLGVYGVLTVQREARMFEETMAEDARLTGRALQAVVERVWSVEGPEAARAILRKASREDQRLEFDCDRFDALPGADQALLRSKGEVVRVISGPAIEVLLPLGWGTPGVPGVIRVRESLSRERRYLRTSAAGIVSTAGTLLVLSCVLSLLIGTRVVGDPIGRLIVKTRQIGRGDLSGALVLPQQDEIGELATAMNEMCRQLQEETGQRRAAETQLRHAERLATVGQMAAGIAHELGTPLNVVIGRGLLIAEDPEASPKIEASAQVVVSQAERMSSIVRQLLDFARLGRQREERTDLAALAADACSLLGPLAGSDGPQIKLIASAPAWIRGDPDQLLQAITNLVRNGLDATPTGGVVTVSVRHEQAHLSATASGEPRRCAVLEVSDTGHGVPASDREHVFEPFFTTKDVGLGTGLGLSVAEGVVSDHGGRIALESDVGVGSRFCIYLPAEDVE